VHDVGSVFAITRTGDGRSAKGAMARAGRDSTVLVMARGLEAAPHIRVVMAGRRPDVRRALQIRLALEPDIAVVGSTSSVQAALPVLRGLRPDVLLVDVDIGPDTPAEALTRARALAPGLRIVLLTHRRDAWPAARLTVYGADEVVDKDPGAGPLLASVRRLTDGRQQGFV
jgi:DNA-binding NarL/FixJ family response regulator